MKFNFEATPITTKTITRYSKVSPILPSNTKTRRLGYLSMILTLFKHTNNYPITHFAQKVEAEAQTINPFLQTYRNARGIIKQSKRGTGNSAKPYISLAKDLSFIVNLNNAYILGKQSKVYRVINTQIENDNLGLTLIKQHLTQNNTVSHADLIDSQALLAQKNPFRLTFFEQAFFLYHLLHYDALYFWLLLEMLDTHQKTNQREIRHLFQKKILQELDRQRNSPYLSNSHKRKTMEISQRIRNWKKPYVYLVHIIMPRLNWLLDLDLLDIKSDFHTTISLSSAGKRLAESFKLLYHHFSEKGTIINFILENYFFQILNHTYGLEANTYQTTTCEQLESYIKESFIHFRSSAPHSIAASQAIYYSCYKLLLEKNELIEFNDIKSLLANNSFKDWRLDWYPRENDGSLQQRR